MEWEIPEIDHKWPVCYHDVDSKPCVFTFVDDRVWIPIQPLTIFLKSRSQFCVLEDFWTQVGNLTANAILTSDFNWSHEHISVCSWSLY